MACGYPGRTWFVLSGMIVTGALRSIAVKLCYQSGLRAPLTVTLLYLLGQALSLVVYAVQKWLSNADYRALSSAPGEKVDGELKEGASSREKSLELNALPASKQEPDDEAAESASVSLTDESTVPSPSSLTSSSSLLEWLSPTVLEFYASTRSSFSSHEDELPNGSNHGLSRESEERVRWAHDIPFYAKPAIPALFNLMNSGLRWAALVFLDASTSEMLISGLELVLSVVAARIFRGRMVSCSRWAGVVIVAVGVIIIERANRSKHEKLDSEEGDAAHGAARDAVVGVILIVLQSVLSVLQDLGEEIFMQATDFPAALMLGMEGAYGFCTGLVIYATVGSRLGVEDVRATLSALKENPRLLWWVAGLPLLFLLTGLFNIKATGVTSAMTRNVWKNMRTVLVWAIALGIFYLGPEYDSSYGEAWHSPQSFVILGGFAVMCAGIVSYYWHKEGERSEAARENDDDGTSRT